MFVCKCCFVYESSFVKLLVCLSVHLSKPLSPFSSYFSVLYYISLLFPRPYYAFDITHLPFFSFICTRFPFILHISIFLLPFFNRPIYLSIHPSSYILVKWHYYSCVDCLRHPRTMTDFLKYIKLRWICKETACWIALGRFDPSPHVKQFLLRYYLMRAERRFCCC